jgi:hypothetical protein
MTEDMGEPENREDPHAPLFRGEPVLHSADNLKCREQVVCCIQKMVGALLTLLRLAAAQRRRRRRGFGFELHAGSRSGFHCPLEHAHSDLPSHKREGHADENKRLAAERGSFHERLAKPGGNTRKTPADDCRCESSSRGGGWWSIPVGQLDTTSLTYRRGFRRGGERPTAGTGPQPWGEGPYA